MKCFQKLIFVIFLAILLVACAFISPATVPVATDTPNITTVPPFVAPSHTPLAIPSPSTIPAITPEPGIPPGCMILNKTGKLYVLSDNVFFALGPSGEELDQILAKAYPKWAAYEQNVSWYPEPVTVGRIIREASFQEKFALNSSVALVTLGESLNWQIPSDSDLSLESLTTSENLHHLWFEWTNPENEQIRVEFSEVTNAATYALYVFFDHDVARLQTWCNSFDQLFGPVE